MQYVLYTYYVSVFARECIFFSYTCFLLTILKCTYTDIIIYSKRPKATTSRVPQTRCSYNNNNTCTTYVYKKFSRRNFSTHHCQNSLPIIRFKLKINHRAAYNIPPLPPPVVIIRERTPFLRSSDK